jgi:hypothetical protein
VIGTSGAGKSVISSKSTAMIIKRLKSVIKLSLISTVSFFSTLSYAQKIQNDKFIPENATLYSETSTTPIRSVQIKESLGSKSIRDGKVQLDMRGLPKGIYYLHLLYQKDSEKSIEKIRLKVE